MSLTVHQCPRLQQDEAARRRSVDCASAHARKITGAFRYRHACGNWDVAAPSWLLSQRKVMPLLFCRFQNLFLILRWFNIVYSINLFMQDSYICPRGVFLPLQVEPGLCFHGNSINMEFMGSSYDGDYKNGR